jgi:hypothetical protein
VANRFDTAHGDAPASGGEGSNAEAGPSKPTRSQNPPIPAAIKFLLPPIIRVLTIRCPIDSGCNETDLIIRDEQYDN